MIIDKYTQRSRGVAPRRVSGQCPLPRKSHSLTTASFVRPRGVVAFEAERCHLRTEMTSARCLLSGAGGEPPPGRPQLPAPHSAPLGAASFAGLRGFLSLFTMPSSSPLFEN